MYRTENMGFRATGCGPTSKILVSCVNKKCRVLGAPPLSRINLWDGR